MELMSPRRHRVVFVLGYAGVGKGTQCARLCEANAQFVHLSVGDLLRKEMDRGGPLSEEIRHSINTGQLIPKEVSISLLKEAIESHSIPPVFLIDGFPSSCDRMEAWNQMMGECECVLYLSCTLEVLRERLIKRDDTAELIEKRNKTFTDNILPVVECYRKLGKVIEIDSDAEIETVYQRVKAAVAHLT